MKNIVSLHVFKAALGVLLFVLSSLAVAHSGHSHEGLFGIFTHLCLALMISLCAFIVYKTLPAILKEWAEK